MSLVSNFIGGISATNFGNISDVSNSFDLNDTTFSDILNKQMATDDENISQGISGLLGVPAGFIIDGIDYSEKVIDQLEASGEQLKIENDGSLINSDFNENSEMTTSEVATFFTSLLENDFAHNKQHSDLFNFAQKQASNLYYKFGRTMVMNLEEFVSDAKEILS